LESINEREVILVSKADPLRLRGPPSARGEGTEGLPPPLAPGEPVVGEEVDEWCRGACMALSCDILRFSAT
jgi:hypothetical protein